MLNQYKLKHLDIEITKSCNLHCLHCSADGGNEGELSTEEIIRVLEQAKKMGVEKIGLTGGEPLCVLSKLESIARFTANELSIPLHMHTNGTLITDALAKGNGVLTLFESISVTFLGSNAEVHDLMASRKGSFGMLMDGIRLITGAGLPLTCYFVLFSHVGPGYGLLVKMLHSIGVNKFRLLALSPSGKARSVYGRYAANGLQARNFQEMLLDTANELPVSIEAGYCTRLIMPKVKILKGHEACMSGKDRLHINAHGDVFPCRAASGVREFRLGNVREGDYQLSRIWNDSDKLRLMRDISLGKIQACIGCPNSRDCRYGCLVKIFGSGYREIPENCPFKNMFKVQ